MEKTRAKEKEVFSSVIVSVCTCSLSLSIPNPPVAFAIIILGPEAVCLKLESLRHLGGLMEFDTGAQMWPRDTT